MFDLNDAGASASRFDLRDINQRLRGSAANWLPRLYPNEIMERDRRSMRCGDLSGRAPRGEGSCIIHLTGPRAGTGHDFATNQHAGPIKLIEHATSLKGKALIEEAARIAGATPIEVQPTRRKAKRDPAQDAERQMREIEHILSGCVPLAGSLAVRYLEGRGLPMPDCPDVLFHPDLTDRDTARGYNGLVAIVRNEKGERTGGIWRTFLSDDGTAKAPPGRKMLGTVTGGAVQLAPVGADGHLGVAEGVETSLAVMQLFGLPCWATLSTSGMRAWNPPANLRRVTIFADAGEPGIAAACVLAGRLAGFGIETAIREPLHGDDFNSDLMRGATMADYQEYSTAVIVPKDSDIIPPIGRAAPPRCYNKLIMTDAEIPQPRDLMANGSLILRSETCFEGRVRYDEHRGAIVCRDMPWNRESDWREWTDTDDNRLAEWAQLREVPLRPGTCAQAVDAVANDNKFHPIRDYLDSLHWDGVPRLDTWLSTYLGVEDTAYARAVGRCWMISGAARIRNPGCKVDHVLILEGDQRLRKSSALKALMRDPDWFSDDMEKMGTKDAAQGLRGKWLIEVAELSALNRSEVETVKAFVSRAVDHYRPSYGRRSQSIPRQSFFAGTTNAETYLADQTGNRRFWPVRCRPVDIRAIERDRNQLWAEADEAFRDGERWWLDDEMESQAADEQQARRIIDSWEEQVLAWADSQSGDITVSRILSECIDQPLERRDDKAQKRVSRILRAAGYKRVQARRNGQRVWIYERPSPPSPVREPDRPKTGDTITH
jgi:hypothetical protein